MNDWHSRNLQNLFLGIVLVPFTWIKTCYFAQLENTSGQKLAYAERDLPLIRPFESPDESFVMIKP